MTPESGIAVPFCIEQLLVGAPDETRLDGDETVLLVEDDPRVLELLRRTLAEHGYEVLTATSPGDALARFGGEPPIDLLVSDVVMPEMSGYELADALRVGRPMLRSFFISGYVRGLRVVGGELEAGVLLLGKPFTQNELLMTTRAILEAGPPRRSR